MQLADIKSCIEQDLTDMQSLMHSSLASPIELVQDVTTYLLEKSGKQVRATLTLLIARALGYEGRQHITVAAILELIHTATLLHDDVIDHSQVRRGKKAANLVWDNSTSILVGDFFYATAFKLLSTIENCEIIRILAETTSNLAQGELNQLSRRRLVNTSEENYLQIITDKTAKLFEASSLIACTLAQKHEHKNDMQAFGLNLGIAFQIIDDTLDLTQNSGTMGKQRGDDIADGKLTLPLIYSLAHSSKKESKVISHAISHGDLTALSQITHIAESCGALDYATERANHFRQKAENSLAPLPESPYKRALLSLSNLVIRRSA